MAQEQYFILIVIAWLFLPMLFLILWLRARKKLSSISFDINKYASDLSKLESTLKIDAKSKIVTKNNLADKISSLAVDHFQTKKTLDNLTVRFCNVIDVDAELLAVQKQQLLETNQHSEKINVWRAKIEELKADYALKKIVYDKLKVEAAIFDEQIGFAELGIYKPHFQFSDSDKFKEEIRFCRDRQKKLVSAKEAVSIGTQWTVDGSKREGQKMTGRAVRLSLRAFNNECDAALSNVRWNNVTTMEKRITRAYEQINKLNETSNINIIEPFLELKLTELFLTHEYREKQKEERDQRTEMNRLKREEERFIRDADKAQKEEEKFQNLLDKAKAEAAKSAGPTLAKYEKQIAELSHDLELAHQKSERAKSMAEQTRAGHIYVISNIGSFGEGIYKIGMTRRLEPSERVKELGDASVPFLFDTHAMIYSEDAPSMEKALHAAFYNRRVNKANSRKEFFKVGLKEISDEVLKISPSAEFVTGIEAQEYFETLAMVEVRNTKQEKTDEFPDTL